MNDGKAMTHLDKIEVDKLSTTWENVVVMYVVGELPSIGALIHFVDREWKLVSKPNVFLHDE